MDFVQVLYMHVLCTQLIKGPEWVVVRLIIKREKYLTN